MYKSIDDVCEETGAPLGCSTFCAPQLCTMAHCLDGNNYDAAADGSFLFLMVWESLAVFLQPEKVLGIRLLFLNVYPIVLYLPENTFCLHY